MVLPAGRPVPLNGTAEPGTELTVEFGTQKKGATADKDGKWRITLDPMPASLESRVLRIHALLADAEALLQDVVVEPPPTPGLRREGSRGVEKGNY
jgi:sialate O-acetylesterase